MTGKEVLTMRKFTMGLLALMLAAGCAGTPPTKFYSLESESVQPALAQLPELSLGLGPVLLPDTLDRPQIVTRENIYNLKLDDSHRWGGNLKANMERHLGHRLKYLLGTQRIYSHPWHRYRQPDYQLQIDVLRFDGELGGEMQLSGTWALLDGNDRRELHLQAFSLRGQAAGPEYRDLVVAMSGLVDRLAEQIAIVIVGQAK